MGSLAVNTKAILASHMLYDCVVSVAQCCLLHSSEPKFCAKNAVDGFYVYYMDARVCVCMCTVYRWYTRSPRLILGYYILIIVHFVSQYFIKYK